MTPAPPNDPRPDVLYVVDQEQMNALISPARVEIVSALEQLGQASVRELADRIGRRPSSLYYHLELLLKTELLQEVESRLSAGRPEVVYELVARRLVLRGDPSKPGSIEAVIHATSSVLRMCDREAKTAIEAGRHVGGNRMSATRSRARLSKEQVAEIFQHVKRIEEIMRTTPETEAGQGAFYTWTSFLTPVEEIPECRVELGDEGLGDESSGDEGLEQEGREHEALEHEGRGDEPAGHAPTTGVEERSEEGPRS